MAGSGADIVDRRRLLEFQRRADDASSLDLETAPRLIVEALSELVGADCTMYGFLDYSLERCRSTTATDPRVKATQDAGYYRWLALCREGGHPIHAHRVSTGDYRAIRLSDLMGTRTFHRLAIYDEFLRPFAIERMLEARVAISSRRDVDLIYFRSGSDFSERDRAVLDQASTTAGQIIRRAEMAPVVKAASSLGLTRREAEVSAWLARGASNAEIAQVLFIAPGTVKKHLDSIYRRLKVRTRTGAAIVVGALVDSQPPPGGSVDERRGVTGAPGLTAREAEVLGLIAEGDRNATIASRLGVRPGTVKDHLDHIYAKLGVNSRTAALAARSPGRLNL